MSLRSVLGRRASSVPLRIGLVVAMVTLTGLVLLACGVAITSSLSNSLTARTDEQISDAVQTWARPRPMKQVDTVTGPRWVPADVQGPPPTQPTSTAEQPRRFFELRLSPTGDIYQQEGPHVSPPQLPQKPVPGPVTVPAVDGSTTWRIVTATNQYGSNTVGLPLTDDRDTVSRLIAFELGTGVAGLVLLGVAGYLVVRRSLRPLRQVEETAAAIVGGDLNRRVPVRNVDTEVDHLAQSLNAMLSQIQHGVAAIEASEEAARRSEAKMRQFVADASHELRTPLTTIRGFAELYRQGASQDPSLVLQRIEGEAGRMSLLVEDLLMLARLDAQRPLERKPVDLLTLAGDAVHNAQAMAAQQAGPDGPTRPISLEIASGTGTLEIRGDEPRLRQVLANLLGNALTHTPPGAPVTVRLTPCPEDVRIDVVDKGHGLSEEAAARVFERFYRTDTSRTRASGGSGLGLSIVRALVTAHGGEVSVSSEPGAGATFSVVVPR
ncbi:sensor histidine kinase [Nocardia sp. alder85J]|uniref:sensor histidine kinase n=1 Tax=Nocardia sp. alder85J TaxID=2862949 RepID=UPI001CD5CB65|nr:HAMP domain-containing sensor histidine kinase [Nocardia sp. alder85J]MCX4097412.1 HAMP domain-containing sensor histidine kinase [Nocardia sp. alder85J]